MSHPLAWLFDIDGTLLHTDGAARESFAQALAEVLGVQDDLRDVAFAGRVENAILADILARHGVTFTERQEKRFWVRVYANMREALRPGRGRLLPGVVDLLDAIAAEPAWLVGLLTGNRSEMARIKLDHFGIAGRFHFGGFGEQAGDRNTLARALVSRVEVRYGVPPGRCVVVGDTEHDVACARAAGARVVAVATGWTSRDVLAACEPNLLLADLETERERLIAWARGISESR
jgi:phosphoglycolate phosphatase-like HAD superfamily hydrolase